MPIIFYTIINLKQFHPHIIIQILMIHLFENNFLDYYINLLHINLFFDKYHIDYLYIILLIEFIKVNKISNHSKFIGQKMFI